MNNVMLYDLIRPQAVVHVSMLGATIASELAAAANIPAFIVDPVVVDEMDDLARYSGIPEIERKSVLHALNHKAMARHRAEELGKPYENCNFIVAHMGGGITVGAHRKGRIVDLNNGIVGEGPFSPERSGGLPLADMIRMCYSNRYSQDEMMAMLTQEGGVKAYLGSNDIAALEKTAEGDPGGQTAQVLKAMAHQIAKEIGSMAAVLEGHVDSIILTGGLAYSDFVTRRIRCNVAWIADVVVYPGEDELLALAQGALRVLRGQETARAYG